MFGSPPTTLMWSNIYGGNQKLPRVQWSRIRKLFDRYRGHIAVVIGCLIGTAVLGLVPVFSVRYIIDGTLGHHDFRVLFVAILCMSGAAGLTVLLSVYQARVNSLIGEAVLRDLRYELLVKLYHAPLSFFSLKRAGDLVNRVSGDVDNIGLFIIITLSTIITNVLVMVTSVVAMVVLDWRLSIVALAALPLMVLPLGPLGRRMYPIRMRTREQRDAVQSHVQDTISMSGIALIKSSAREDLEAARSLQLGNELLKTEVDLETAGRWFTALVNALAILGPAAVWFVGGYLALNGSTTAGVVIAFVALLGRLYAPASTLAGVHVQFISALALFDRVFEYLDLVPEDEPDSGKTKLETVKGAVSFDRVSYAYEGGGLAVDSVSFDIEPGQVVGIVGPSGSGKTTIAHLMMCFFHPHAGAVRVDGHDLHDLNLKNYRGHVGIVQQETYLSHDTIANNIRYGKPDATDAAIVEAAKAANIHDVITEFPDGYETIVGDRGHRLSGGERQRVAIARALLRDPAILLLDEATSNLDAESERAVQEGLHRLMVGRTSIVIAHRLSTIVHADKIIVIDGGRLVESGTHRELLARRGRYWELYTNGDGAELLEAVS